ncbi:hypothetical protein CRV24_006421 [Beauveria bassiana]|nr:hypothetical protein CRV24_006421 [Beauveria bassiana]KAH8713455.1 hypothetical protein HC256_006612 [Beauveria bassiana]
MDDESLVVQEAARCRYLVGSGDKYGIFHGPHVPVARLHTELAPEDIEALMLVVHARSLHLMVADSRVRAVSTEHNVKLDLYALGEPDSILHQGRAAMKVDMDELMIEEQLYVGSPSMQSVRLALRAAQSMAKLVCHNRSLAQNIWSLLRLAATYSPQGIEILRHLLEVPKHRFSVDHSAPRRHGGIKDTLEELWLPRVTQGVLVALRESEVDELSGAEAANVRITKMCGQHLSEMGEL